MLTHHLLGVLPQILNFLYSIPQLFKLVPCPRHRMPGFDQKTNTLTMSYAEFTLSELPAPGRLVVRVCKALRLGHCEVEAATGRVKMSNMTLINYALYVLGPMREDKLTLTLLALQTVCSALALVVRYQLAGLFYEVVR